MTDLNDIEQMASESHARWFQQRWGRGVMSEKSSDGEELMQPYAGLSESAKDIFRKQALLEKIFS